jgi:hypothetical protein
MEQQVVRGLSGLPFAAIALPGAILAALSVGALATAAAGRHPLWRHDDLNMSEAAALRDAATVLRLVRAGESPTVPRRIRPRLLSARAVTLTPLEAAIAAERPEIVQLLMSVMDRIDAATWVRARCLAVRGDDREVDRVLDSYKPKELDGAMVDCSR